MGHRQPIQLQKLDEGSFEVRKEDAFLKEDGSWVTTEITQQGVLMRLFLLPVDISKKRLLEHLHVLQIQHHLRTTVGNTSIRHLAQRAGLSQSESLVPSKDQQEVPILLSWRVLLPEVDEGMQFDAVVGLLLRIGQSLELLHTALPGLEGVLVEDVPVSLPVVLDHLRQGLLSHLHPIQLPSQINLKLELPYLVINSIQAQHQSSICKYGVFLDLSFDILVVPAEELAEEVEILDVSHSLSHFAGVQVLDNSCPAVIEQLTTGSLGDLLLPQPTGPQCLGKHSIGPAHEGKVLIAVELILPAQLHKIVGGRSGWMFGLGESDEQGIEGIVGSGAGTRNASEQVPMMHGYIGPGSKLGRNLIQSGNTRRPLLTPGFLF